MNAARHGALAKLAVLPGERVEDHAANLDDWMVQLRPTTAAEARAVVLIADLAMRLDRVRRVEGRMQVAVLDEQVAKSDAFAAAVDVKRAVVVLDELILELHRMGPPPTSGPHLLLFVRAARSVANIVHDVAELPLAEVSAFDASLDALDVGPTDAVDANCFSALLVAATSTLMVLRQRSRRCAQQIAQLKKALAGANLLVDAAEAKRCARYREQIQKAILSQLEILSAVREVAARGRRRPRRGSFGKAPRTLPVRLRIVS